MLMPRLHTAVAALLLALAAVLGGVVMIADALTPSTAPAADIPRISISFPISTEQCPTSPTGWSIVNEIECLKGK